MPDPLHLELAHHLDRLRRKGIWSRPGVIVRDLPSGAWLSVYPAEAPMEFASFSSQRVYWHAQPGPIDPAEVPIARALLREAGCPRAFAWLAPWTWSEAFEAALGAAGAARVPHVDYIALHRETTPAPAAPRCGLNVRRVEPDEAARVAEAIAPWYSEQGAARIAWVAQRGLHELHAAFEGDTPVAVGLLAPDDPWGYLNGAGTHPAWRGRGAQSALIAARISRAADLGLRHLSCETNNVDRRSLRNLRRLGFRDTISWLVYRWDL